MVHIVAWNTGANSNHYSNTNLGKSKQHLFSGGGGRRGTELV
jgi:hypothetical protein